jgi:Flp pilus assembly pilin Flp
MNEPHHNHHSPQDEHGQTLSEYSVLIGLLAIVLAAVVPVFGAAVASLYQGVIGLFGG